MTDGDDDLPALLGHSMPESPPLLAFSDVRSPTSSEPPLFSSDPPLADEDLSHYESPRLKRKRRGPWWEAEQPERELPLPKRRDFSRNFDSGIGMLSSQEIAPLDQPAGDPINVDSQAEPFISATAREFTRQLHLGIERNDTTFSFTKLGLSSSDIASISDLNHVIHQSVDPGQEVPHERQFSSMVPDLKVRLGWNSIRALHPNIFSVQHLTFLSLRHNSIEELPRSICQLKNLRELDLCNNRLTTLPEAILLMLESKGGGALKELRFKNNPLLERSDHDLIRWQLKTSTADDEAYLSRNAEPNACDVLEAATYGPESTKSLVEREAVSWFTVWLSQWSGLVFKGVVDERLSHDYCYIASSPISYYDPIGNRILGSPAFPQAPGDHFKVLVHARNRWIENGVEVTGPPPAYRPKRGPKARSLFTLALNKAMELGGPQAVKDLYASEQLEIPPCLEQPLEIAHANERQTFSPLRACRCGKTFTIVQAEWVEFWSTYYCEFMPFRFQVCSWACAERFYDRDRTEG